MSDSSDSEMETPSKTKPKKATVFDDNVFDAEESDEKTKPMNRKKKTNPQQSQPTKKPLVKLNNEQIKKEKSPKTNDEQATTKKKITIPKIIEKKKLPVAATKSTSKVIKPTTTAQKRPSTDEPNESNKKLKLDDDKSKTPAIEEQISTTSNHTESDISTSHKPSIVVSSPTNDISSNLPKTVEPSVETNSQTTPTKFGIVFTSHHRQSTTTPPAPLRTQSTETSASHETSKNEDEDMNDDHESGTINNKTINENDKIPTNTNTLKPPATKAQAPLSDDETLNPETMQLSDLIGGTRREGTTSAQSRSGGKTTGKGKRAAKQDTTSNKRQQTKTNSKAISSTVSNEKELEPSVVLARSSSVEQTPSLITNAKRLSSTESASVSSPNNDKEAKRLRKSIDDSTTTPTQVKLEPIENLSQWANTQIKEESFEPKISSEMTKAAVLPPSSSSSSVTDQSQIISMETDQIPLSSSIITSKQSPSRTSAETEHAIKAVYSTIQIPQASVSKPANLEKSSPIIAPISKETLPIVEHQPTPIQTTSIVPAHVPIKSSSLSSATFSMFLLFNSLSFFNLLFCFADENVEETLSAVNSLLMLNNNPPNISGDHPPNKGTARVTPTISKPVYTFVASLPSPTDQQSRQTTTATPTATTASVSTSSTQPKDLITMVSNIVSSSNLSGEKQPVTNISTTTAARSHIEEVIDDVAKGASTTSTTIVTEPTTSIVDTNPLTSASLTSTATTKSTPIPHILRDVMKTPCLTSSTTVTTTTTTTAASETLNIFDSHRRSTSPLKTATSSIPSTTTTTSSTPVVPVVVRPTSAKTPTTHKRSSTPKTEPPSAQSTTMHPFPHMLASDSTLFAAAAAHHQNFPFPLFGPLSSNPANPTGNSSSNLLASSLVSNSPPLSTRTSSTSSSSSITNSHMMTNSFLNTIMTAQPNSNQHTHEKGSRR